jgi:hypothetical protein
VLRVYLWTVCVYLNQIIRVCTCGVRAKLTPAPVNAKVVQFQSSLATTQKISFGFYIYNCASLGHELCLESCKSSFANSREMLLHWIYIARGERFTYSKSYVVLIDHLSNFVLKLLHNLLESWFSNAMVQTFSSNDVWLYFFFNCSYFYMIKVYSHAYSLCHGALCAITKIKSQLVCKLLSRYTVLKVIALIIWVRN